MSPHPFLRRTSMTALILLAGTAYLLEPPHGQAQLSREAIELYLASEVIDLHWDTYLWYRLMRYDPRRRHGHGLLGARLYSHVDIPRLREACVGGLDLDVRLLDRLVDHGDEAFLIDDLHLLLLFDLEPIDELARGNAQFVDLALGGDLGVVDPAEGLRFSELDGLLLGDIARDHLFIPE